MSMHHAALSEPINTTGTCFW